MRDLVVLVADKNMQFTIRGALNRPEALSIRAVSFDFRIHPGRDGGVRTSGVSLLSSESRRFHHALLFMDHAGCGDEGKSPIQLEQQLDHALQETWGTQSKAIVIAPEVDAWIWGNDNVLAEIFHWPTDKPTIREWLGSKGFEFDEHGKPLQPKEALNAMRPVHKQPRSSALYENITKRISLDRCTDLAFQRARRQLQSWFSINIHSSQSFDLES